MLNLVVFFILLISCNTNDKPFPHDLKRQNLKGEYICRTHDQVTYIPPLRLVPVAPYPWENKGLGKLPLVGKEYFRCKGSTLNPVRSEVVSGQVVKYHDCGGAQKHSLPLKDGKEWIYPILIELVNYLQLATGKQVVITSGYRCPDHNAYVDPSPLNQYSKHQIGAEVDFYIQGMENQPEKIVDLLISFYQQKYKDMPELSQFRRYEKSDTNTSTKPWMNKEIFIKIFKNREGRNYDNRHPYPYISLQVRFDREKNERVLYSWEQAFRNFLRY